MESVTSPKPVARAVFVRHAAAGREVLPEVLMGVRGSGHRFMPNRLVFPGGAIDPSDRIAPAAVEPNEATLGLLQRRAHPRLARAIVFAAARELSEETGLSLGTPPRLDAMHYLCRAVTPPHLPIRFNARFLIAPAEAVSGTLQDTRELHDTRFIPLADALAQDMMGVTRQVLLRVQAWLALPPADRPGRHLPEVFRLERWQAD